MLRLQLYYKIKDKAERQQESNTKRVQEQGIPMKNKQQHTDNSPDPGTIIFKPTYYSACVHTSVILLRSEGQYPYMSPTSTLEPWCGDSLECCLVVQHSEKLLKSRQGRQKNDMPKY